MKSSLLYLIEKMQQLRGTAGAIYDTAMANGMNKEAANEAIEPIRRRLQELLSSCARENVGACVMAIRSMESQIEAYEMDIKFLRQKMSDARMHIYSVKKELTKRMQDEEVSTLHEGDFFVALVDLPGGGTDVSIR